MRVAAVATILFLLLAACAQDTSSRPSPPEDLPMVRADGDRFVLDDRTWWPAGLNAYQLGTRWEVNHGCGAEVDLDEFFGALAPRSVVRFDAFQSHAVHRIGGTLDFTALDAVFDAAERHRVYLIPVLAPQDSECDAGGYKQADWYDTGWRDPLPGHVLAYDDWVATAVDRWGSSSVVAMWELIGEPETATCTDEECTLERRECLPGGARLLRGWIDDAAAIVREHDPDRLVTVGTIGGDQCGSAGDDFTTVAGAEHLDVVQYHDYDDAQFLEQRLDGLSKPMLVAELGVRAGSCRGVNERADIVDRTLTQYRELGADGALMWSFVPDPRPDECTYDIGPDDPVHYVLRRHHRSG
ncbi:beta-mannosidase [Rhodococcus pyridinivorans]|uniref:beta-mannosidase n=1 Tax=Rhodococcus pyridinivorans TaxID=103816 RepID=UPI00228532B8|nr:beta-mannosidase [Rhodococcus pyridinivorans]WAL45768.1 beta-mannosidase [Rhodococcus pyridinivorans]